MSKYRLWSANITIFDPLLLLLFSLTTVRDYFSKNEYFILKHSPIFFLLTSSIFGYGLMFYNGFSLSTYFDSLIVLFRIIAIYYIAFDVLNSKIEISKTISVLFYSAFILAGVSLMAYYFLDYTSTSEGRLNTLGMGVNITAEFFTIIFIYAFASKYKRYYLEIVLIIISIWLLFLTGSKRAVGLIAVLYILMKMRNYKNNQKLVFLFSLTIATAFILIFYQPLIVVLHEVSDNRIVNALHEILVETEYGNFIDKLKNIFSTDAVFTKKDNRFYMYNMTYKLLLKYPWGLGNSNWLIQSELYRISGVASHTHNFIIQWYLRYGVFIVVLIYPMLRFIKGLKYKTTASLVLTVFLINNTFGYGLWNMKYLVLMVIFYVINEKEIIIRKRYLHEID
ncbi:MAG: oligosaccharide repeat unit polymerase [Flavobacteriaceae bacterium]|nr:oligosaccharide repeat unit polymerase [Flavobacteriaceae bacterium]